jgi:hypothetical protein
MIDGCHELANLEEMCDKCMFGEWKGDTLRECKADLHGSYDFEYGPECGCSGGCSWCLDVEARIGGFR